MLLSEKMNPDIAGVGGYGGFSVSQTVSQSVSSPIPPPAV